MDVPVILGDRVDAEQAVLTAIPHCRGSSAAETIAIDAAIDHDMRDMDTERTVVCIKN
jgi:hypothetical protein